MREGSYVVVDGVRTHYFEAGRGKPETVLLLHSAEFGGCAEFSWEFSMAPLGEHFHVLAPDHLGFGLTDKVFDFNGQFDRRIAHIRRFLEVMDVKRCHVVGSSMSGGLTLTVAARPRPDWPVARIVVCSGGGDAPNNEARQILNSYDGTREHMRRIVEVMFTDPRWARDEDYISRRHEIANLPGGWEATQAARFKAPFRASSEPRERDAIAYGDIRVPTLVMAGRHDPLRAPGYAEKLAAGIPGSQLHVFENASHMGNIECADEFNRRVIAFLKG
ncbi:MAG TPA: alpha/beta hydrolase [Alphaproteobacteria bacterium]|jgi:pimeloyl-ACP methyl ester carboxylesterase